jgi:hypothetical protein
LSDKKVRGVTDLDGALKRGGEAQLCIVRERFPLTISFVPDVSGNIMPRCSVFHAVWVSTAHSAVLSGRRATFTFSKLSHGLLTAITEPIASYYGRLLRYEAHRISKYIINVAWGIRTACK